jgi:hypothetical protein
MYTEKGPRRSNLKGWIFFWVYGVKREIKAFVLAHSKH